MRPVFDLAIDHGARPNLARYVYAIVPGVSLNQFRRTVQNKPFAILENNGRLQAVYGAHMSTVEAVFYEAGRFSTPLG